MSNRYNRSLKYMQHHELNNVLLYKTPLRDTFLLSITMSIFLLIFEVKYFPVLKAFDVTLVANFLMYLFVIRPSIYKGRIKAYYRRKYLKLRGFIRAYSVLAMFSLGRIVGFTLYFFAKEKSYIGKLIIEDSYNPTVTLLVSLASIFLLYLVFFQDKYVIIKEYSNEIIHRRKEHGMSKEESIKDFLMTKDKEYDVKEFLGVYYDYNDSKGKENNKINDEEKDEDIIRRSLRS